MKNYVRDQFCKTPEEVAFAVETLLTDEADDLLDELRSDQPLSKKSKKNDDESDDSVDLKKLTKKELIERLQSRQFEYSSDSSSQSEEGTKKKKTKSSQVQQKPQPSSKKTAQVEECDAIAIVYSVPSEKHPFHHLDGQYASVEIEDVFDLEKEGVEKDKSIQFIKSVGDEHILIDAIITSNKVFKVPKKKAGKFIIGKSNMTDISPYGDAILK